MSTKKMLEAYIQETAAPLFLTSFFQAPAENYHNAEEVEVDIQRMGEDVAVPVTNVGDGYRYNQTGGFSNKKVAPPVYKEAEAISSISLMSRVPGKSDYDDPVFQAAALQKALRSSRTLENKIRRSMELQASQIFTTGAISLTDSTGAVVFAEAFGAKNTHFANSGVAWSGAADPTSDILAACDLIRNDSAEEPVRVIFGSGSLEAALAFTSFQKRFDNDSKIELGAIAPDAAMASRGGQRVGRLWAGGYWLECWTYNGAYKSPAGAMTKYVPNDKVIVMANSRLDATFGGIPTFGTDGRAAAFIPGRITNSNARMDIQMNAWISPDGTVLNIGYGSRPLMIPTAIDSFACIDTQI